MSDRHYIPQACEGEPCTFEQESGPPRVSCGEPAEYKVEEWVFADDPTDGRHPLTCYVCHKHFRMLMGPMADRVRQLRLMTAS
jgi:formylmethanofuran:tetrahydromethanopterin formyltransferase